MTDTGPNACRPLTPLVLLRTHFIGKTVVLLGEEQRRSSLPWVMSLEAREFSPWGERWACRALGRVGQGLGLGLGLGVCVGDTRPCLCPASLTQGVKERDKQAKPNHGGTNAKKSKEAITFEVRMAVTSGGGGQEEAGTRRGPGWGAGGGPLGGGNIPTICEPVVGISLIILYSVAHLSLIHLKVYLCLLHDKEGLLFFFFKDVGGKPRTIGPRNRSRTTEKREARRLLGTIVHSATARHWKIKLIWTLAQNC